MPISILIVFAFSTIFDRDILVILTSVYMVISAVFCNFISGLFVYKLFKVYQKFVPVSATNDDGLLSIITKNTLLAVISVTSTILNSIIVVFAWNNLQNIPLWYIKDVCLVLEMYTNFCCILLTYKYFNNHYDKFCGCMDRKCKYCCHIVVGKANSKSNAKSGIEASVTAV